MSNRSNGEYVAKLSSQLQQVNLVFHDALLILLIGLPIFAYAFWLIRIRTPIKLGNPPHTLPRPCCQIKSELLHFSVNAHFLDHVHGHVQVLRQLLSVCQLQCS